MNYVEFFRPKGEAVETALLPPSPIIPRFLVDPSRLRSAQWLQEPDWPGDQETSPGPGETWWEAAEKHTFGPWEPMGTASAKSSTSNIN